MLIVSDFHDYYDSIAKLGVDKAVVYNRKTSFLNTVNRWNETPYIVLDQKRYEIDLPAIDAVMGGRNRKPFDCQLFYVGFCGKTYKGVWEKAYLQDGVQIPDKFLYEGNVGFSEVFEYVKNIRISWRHKADDYDKQIPLRFFNLLQTPVILYLPDRYRKSITLNPRLADYQFVKVKDTYSAFQELQQFISGVLGADEKPIIQISDINKLENHGFDKKKSFRHPVK